MVSIYLKLMHKLHGVWSYLKIGEQMATFKEFKEAYLPDPIVSIFN